MKLSRIILFSMLLFGLQNCIAHALWVETNTQGKKGVTQSVKVYFAEVGEKWEPVNGQEWAMVKNFELWLQSPKGELSRLEVSPQQDYYQANFTPKEDGIYQVIVKNTSIGPLNFPNTPPFIPYFYAKSAVQVGNTKSKVVAYELPLNFNLIQKKINLVVPPYADGKAEVKLFTPSGELKTFKNLQNGVLDFDFAEKGIYQIELQIKDERPGKDYEFAFHNLTSNVLVSK